MTSKAVLFVKIHLASEFLTQEMLNEYWLYKFFSLVIKLHSLSFLLLEEQHGDRDRSGPKLRHCSDHQLARNSDLRAPSLAFWEEADRHVGTMRTQAWGLPSEHQNWVKKKKKSRHAAMCLQSQWWVSQAKWIPGAYWPVLLAYWVFSRPVRDPVWMNKADSSWGRVPKVLLWPPYVQLPASSRPAPLPPTNMFSHIGACSCFL